MGLNPLRGGTFCRKLSTMYPRKGLIDDNDFVEWNYVIYKWYYIIIYT